MFFPSPRLPVLDRAQELISETADLARIGGRSASSFIHERPVSATLIGMGAGMLLGFLAGGRTSKSRGRSRGPRRKSRPARRSRRSATSARSRS